MKFENTSLINSELINKYGSNEVTMLLNQNLEIKNRLHNNNLKIILDTYDSLKWESQPLSIKEIDKDQDFFDIVIGDLISEDNNIISDLTIELHNLNNFIYDNRYSKIKISITIENCIFNNLIIDFDSCKKFDLSNDQLLGLNKIGFKLGEKCFVDIELKFNTVSINSIGIRSNMTRMLDGFKYNFDFVELNTSILEIFDFKNISLNLYSGKVKEKVEIRSCEFTFFKIGDEQKINDIAFVNIVSTKFKYKHGVEENNYSVRVLGVGKVLLNNIDSDVEVLLADCGINSIYYKITVPKLTINKFISDINTVREVQLLSLVISDNTDFMLRDCKNVALFVESADIYSKNFKVYSNTFNSVIIKESVFRETGIFSDNKFNNSIFELSNATFIGTIFTNNNWGHITRDRFNGNRDSYRYLKYNFDSVGNKIEASAFHAVELEHAIDDPSIGVMDKVVLTLNKIISNFSQSYILPIFWYICSIFFFYTINLNDSYSLILTASFFIIPFICILMFYKDTLFRYIVLSIFYLYICANIFPFNHFDFFRLMQFVFPLSAILVIFENGFKQCGNEIDKSLIILLFLCQVVQIFILYQLQIALRKNTRR